MVGCSQKLFILWVFNVYYVLSVCMCVLVCVFVCMSNHEIGSDSAMSCVSRVEKLLACIQRTTDDKCAGGVVLKRQFIQGE